jgi:hypothetical protein
VVFVGTDAATSVSVMAAPSAAMWTAASPIGGVGGWGGGGVNKIRQHNSLKQTNFFLFVQPKYGYAMFALKVFGSVQMSYFDTHHKKIWGVGQNDFFSLRLNILL